MVFGRKKEASDEAEPWTRVDPPRPHVDQQYRQPTDVTWDPQGNIYISDGYINSRVAKMNKDGEWLKSWGERGAGAGPAQHAAQHRLRRQGQHLRRRPRQHAYPGVRHRGQGAPRDQDRRALPDPATKPATGNMPSKQALSGGHQWRPARPWAICINPGPERSYLRLATPIPAASTS